MKNILAFILCFLSIYSFSQNIEEAIQSLATGDVSSLKPYFDTNISVSINDNAETLSVDQAATRISNFLNQAKPNLIKAKHSGLSHDQSSSYQVAQLITEDDNYRVFIYFEKKDDRSVIKEIRFDKE